MPSEPKRIEVTLETVLDSVDLAESIVMRVAEAAGFDEEDLHKIGMSVREGVINAYNYGNQQDRGRKLFLKVELEEKEWSSGSSTRATGSIWAKYPIRWPKRT